VVTGIQYALDRLTIPILLVIWFLCSSENHHPAILSGEIAEMESRAVNYDS
jgi:hypothetical protein